MAFDMSSYTGTTIPELLDYLYPEYTPRRRRQAGNEKPEDDVVILSTNLPHPGTENPTFVDKSSAKWPGFENKNCSSHYAAGRYLVDPDGSPREFLGYLPMLGRISDATLRQLPRFLFRVTCDNSAGNNQEGHCYSQAIKFGTGEAHFFTFSNTDIKESLHNHEINKRRQSHWISFTDSGTAALAYALQLHEQKKNNVRFHMVDTTRIRNFPLIVHAYASMLAYRVCSNKNAGFQKMILGASYAEFLGSDELEIESCSVDITVLIGAGLFDLPMKLKAPVRLLGKSGSK